VVTVATLLAACAAAVALWLVAAGGAQASSHDQPAGTGLSGMTRVVVKPGQTLWALAAAAEPTANTQTVVQQIINANALGSSTIYAGQTLWVPAA
jgi:LysM repeat protein